MIACGTMYFEPRHPVMMQCLDQAMKLGRTVKWGDAGPRLLTRVLKERGLHHRAHPPSVCYPVHYTQALDALRPSRTAELSRQMEGALFLHLWHSTLEFHGVRKACRPPQRSLLREWADKHPVDGWTGEYDEQTLEQIVSMRVAIEGHLAENGRLRAELNAKAREAARLQASLDRSQGRLEAMLASTSWRLTAPLRAGRRGLFTLRVFRKGQ